MPHGELDLREKSLTKPHTEPLALLPAVHRVVRQTIRLMQGLLDYSCDDPAGLAIYFFLEIAATVLRNDDIITLRDYQKWLQHSCTRPCTSSNGVRYRLRETPPSAKPSASPVVPLVGHPTHWLSICKVCPEPRRPK